MADQYGLFFNSINGDRVYDADSFSEWLNKFFTTGVFNGELQVTADSGMAVNVASGYANINGKVRFFEQSQTFTLDPASGVYPRIDTIVVRLDTTNRMITTEYVKGDYSGNNPQPTEPTRTGGLYEIVLAQIYVSAGATQILTNDITDTRSDDSVCGWVTSTVEGVPMDQIVSQMTTDFMTWFDHMKGQLSEDAAGNLQLQIDETNTRIDGVDTEIGDTDISSLGDGTITGAVSALNNGLSDLNSGYIYQRFDKAVAASTDTNIGSITLPTKGMWLVIAVADLNVTLENVYNFVVYGRVVRGYGSNGGGATNALLINATSNNTAVDVKGYVPGKACNFRCTIQAIKLR